MYERNGQCLDLAQLTRLYPAALVSSEGESASVSLEWAESKTERITLEAYVLICDVDPIGEVPVNRVEFRFQTKEELFASMEEIARLLRS